MITKTGTSFTLYRLLRENNGGREGLGGTRQYRDLHQNKNKTFLDPEYFPVDGQTVVSLLEETVVRRR